MVPDCEEYSLHFAALQNDDRDCILSQWQLFNCIKGTAAYNECLVAGIFVSIIIPHYTIPLCFSRIQKREFRLAFDEDCAKVCALEF